jgi:plastocyanin
MRRITASSVLAAILAGLPGAIYGSDGAPVATTLVVTSYEYSFQAPDSLPAGVTTVRFVNRGKQSHQLVIARLDDTSSLARVMKSITDDKVHTSGITWVGGVESAIPGETATATLRLSAGRYVLVCGLGEPAHMSLGMIRPMVITRGAHANVEQLPAASTTIELSDYHIGLSRPLHSGKQLVRVVNVGKHRHHLYISRIVGNATTEAIMRWDGKSEPAPLAEMSGGAASMDAGQTNVIELNLEPGRYGLACVLSNDANSKPHYLLGMHDEITVR